MNTCYICGAGDGFIPFEMQQGDFLIAADGGYQTLMRNGLFPDVIMGDFDSAAMPDHPMVKAYPPEKDDTDMLLCIRHGLALGYQEFVLLGGSGGRLDHTIANAQCLCFLAEKGCLGTLVGDGYFLSAICNGQRTLHGKQGKGFSVFCMDKQASGVTIEHAKYNVFKATLQNTTPIGVSNEFCGEPVNISVENGTLLLYWEV